LNNLLNVDLKRKGTIVGVGYIFRSQKVFFTLNGKEVYQMRLPECMSGITKLFPTVSLGSLKDRIQLNFGEGKTQFRFDLASKVQDYYRNIFDDIVQGEYGEASSVFSQRQPPTALELAKEYLYAQGYFKTL